MNRLMKAVLHLVVFLLIFSSCTPDPVSLTGGTETGDANVVGMLYHPDGKTPAAGILVKIRPRSTLADTSGLGVGLPEDTASSVTNSYGRFAFDSTLSSGTYVIEALDGNNAVLIDSVIVNQSSTDSIPPDTLKPAGAIRGIIKLSEGGDPRKVFVLAFGIDRFARVEEDGRFKFSSLAEACYDLRFISGLNNYGVFDTVKISVISEDTTDLDTINLPFTGIPTPKALSVNYDTLTNRVMLFWSTENPHLVSGYKVYRREESNVQYTIACDTILNSTSFTDGIVNGLEKGRTYQYIIRAVDSLENEGTNSEHKTVRIAFFVDAGKDTTCQLGDSVLLEARIDSSTVTPTEYRFDATGDGTNDFVSATVPTFKYTYADTGTFKAIVAIRSNTTIYSDTVIIRITPKDTTGAPSAPQNVKLSYDTLSQKVTIQWSKPWESDFKGCNIYRKDDGANQYTIVNKSLVTDTIFIDSLSNGLVKGSSYQYYLTAFDNSNNESQNSVSISVRIAFFVDAGKDTTYQLGDSVTLKARVDTNTIAATEYRFDANGDGTNDFVSATATTFIYAYADTGTYKAVITIQGNNRTFSDTMKITIVPKDTSGAPVAPKGLSLSYDTLKQIVTLTWIRNLENDIKGYNVYRKHSDSALVKINTALITGTTYSDSTPIQEQIYEYKIAAVDNADNEGKKSAGVSVGVVSAYSLADTIGTKGTNDNQLYMPRYAVSKNGTYLILDVVSPYPSEVKAKIFNTNGTLSSSFSIRKNSSADLIYGMCAVFDKQNNLIVCFKDSTFKFDSTGNLINKYKIEFASIEPRSTYIKATDTILIYVMDQVQREILVKSQNNDTISKFAMPTASINNLSGLTVDSLGNIYVGDIGGKKILKYNSSGSLLMDFGSNTMDTFAFGRIQSILIDPKGRLIIDDANRSRIFIFDNQGKYICQFETYINTKIWQGTVNDNSEHLNMFFNADGSICLLEGNSFGSVFVYKPLRPSF